MRGGRKSDILREREIGRERETSEWMEDGGGQIGCVWGWSGVGWWSVVAKSAIGGGSQISQGVGEPSGARLAVDCQDQSSTCTHQCMAGYRRGRSWVFVDR